jgi:hypothetical protein
MICRAAAIRLTSPQKCEGHCESCDGRRLFLRSATLRSWNVAVKAIPPFGAQPLLPDALMDIAGALS